MFDKNKGNPAHSDEQKLLAYFTTMIRNSDKNEYRQNANAFNHISATGVWFDGYRQPVGSETDIESQIGAQRPEDWLLFIEDARLHAALCSLKSKDLEFVFVMFRNGYTQRQMAAHLGIRQNAVHERWRRIRKIIETFF